MFIQTEATPNPNVLKFLPGRDVLGEGTREFTIDQASASPLAEALFDLNGVQRVFFGLDFLTVTKATDEQDWRELKAPILAAIMEHFTSGAPILVGEAAPQPVSDQVYDGETAQIVAEIKELLDTRVRPAVAQDGGDITFRGFRDGTVFLNMKGACSGCPSSTATLKHGVQNLLRHFVPEVREVEAV